MSPKVNPLNVNPHFQRPEEFGLKPCEPPIGALTPKATDDTQVVG